MSKLGEGKLGSTRFAEPSELEISETIQDEVRERAEDVLKSIYTTEEGTNWDKILDIVLHEFEREYEVIEDIIAARFIDDATDRQLDKLGEMWQIERRTNESDEHFRARIKTQLPRHTGRGTIDELLNVSALLLRTATERIHLEENFIPKFTEDDLEEWQYPDEWATLDDQQRDLWLTYQMGENYETDLPTDWDTMSDAEQEQWLADAEGIVPPEPWEEMSDYSQERYLHYHEQTAVDTEPWEPARFDLVVDEIVFTDSDVDIDDYETLVQDVKPAGVRAMATIGEQFTHRSVADFEEGTNAADKGYGGFDDETVDGYVQGAPSTEPATLTAESERLDIGGPYADEITTRFT